LFFAKNDSFGAPNDSFGVPVDSFGVPNGARGGFDYAAASAAPGALAITVRCNVYDLAHLLPVLVYVPMPSAKYLARKSPAKTGRLLLSANPSGEIIPSNVTLASSAHLLKASLPMLVTLFGIVTLVRLLQL